MAIYAAAILGTVLGAIELFHEFFPCSGQAPATMRFLAALLPVTAFLCSALVIPDQGVLSGSFRDVDEREYSGLAAVDDASRTETALESWREVVATLARSGHESAAELGFGLVDLDRDSGWRVENYQKEDEDDDDDSDGDDDQNRDEPHRLSPPRPRPQPPKPCPPLIVCSTNHTIWEMISKSDKTMRLADLLAKETDLVNLLSSTNGSYTVFAPTNSAIEHLLGEGLSSASISRILEYHVVPGSFSADWLKRQRTLPTSLTESALGKNMEQRIVVSLQPQGQVLLDGVAQIIAGDMVASNGILHQIDTPLMPPPNTSTILALLPARFSTFALGLQRTHLAGHVSAKKRHGGTTFAPTNAAWRRLGVRANAFLFSARGEQCLRSLLQYHLVPARTLYSDTLYDVHGQVQTFGNRTMPPFGAVHVELPTLLQGQKIYIDVARRRTGSVVLVNGFYRVMPPDVLASDGVVHVLDQVLVPPKQVGERMPGQVEEEVMEEVMRELLPGCEEMGVKTQMTRMGL